MKYFVGNWKANKTQAEVEDWVSQFVQSYTPQDDKSFGICPPYQFLSYLHNKLDNIQNVFVGAQSISSVEAGSYTGEVTAKSLEGIVRFTIIGHSERRKHFGETDEDLATKVIQAKKYRLEPIYCVRDENDPIPQGVKFVAYEPVAAIGTGQNESLENILTMRKKMSLPDNCIFLYGGSVNAENISEYLESDKIDGFLIGKASLEPNAFLAIAASK